MEQNAILTVFLFCLGFALTLLLVLSERYPNDLPLDEPSINKNH